MVSQYHNFRVIIIIILILFYNHFLLVIELNFELVSLCVCLSLCLLMSVWLQTKFI